MTGLSSTAETILVIYAVFNGAALFATIVLITKAYFENDAQFIEDVENAKKYVYSYVNEHIILYYIALFLIFIAYIMVAGIGLALFMSIFGMGAIVIIVITVMKACFMCIKPPATANNIVVPNGNIINPV